MAPPERPREELASGAPSHVPSLSQIPRAGCRHSGIGPIVRMPTKHRIARSYVTDLGGREIRNSSHGWLTT
ncbi:hypothetical protein NLI96_g11132 [Meripilus lineatus]|uniref:Uncharacterized protein n=1 Tax=Meripilus lineatus TaxID=2056292 RepID=A0AAD5UTX0_9APHY|nr:hypothetical protein NLI96_g11132 [Physisporinus lineatus]